MTTLDRRRGWDRGMVIAEPTNANTRQKNPTTGNITRTVGRSFTRRKTTSSKKKKYGAPGWRRKNTTLIGSPILTPCCLPLHQADLVDPYRPRRGTAV